MAVPKVVQLSLLLHVETNSLGAANRVRIPSAHCTLTNFVLGRSIAKGAVNTISRSKEYFRQRSFGAKRTQPAGSSRILKRTAFDGNGDWCNRNQRDSPQWRRLVYVDLNWLVSGDTNRVGDPLREQTNFFVDE